MHMNALPHATKFQDLPHQTEMPDQPLHGEEVSGKGKMVQNLYCSYLRPRLLIPVLGFLFYIPEIQNFQDSEDSEDSSSITFFCTGIPIRSGFIFGPQNSNQDSCRNSGFLRHVGISTSVPGFYSGGLPKSTIRPSEMGSKVGLLLGQLVGRALI